MSTKVNLFLNWRTIPSGIRWQDEVHRKQPDPQHLRLSVLPSFHFEPCDSGGTPTTDPVDIPPQLLDSLAMWPEVLAGLKWSVQMELLSKVSAGIGEDYQYGQKILAALLPQPTQQAIDAGRAILKATFARNVITRTPVQGSCGAIMKGAHLARSRRIRGFDDVPHMDRVGASLIEAHQIRAQSAFTALTEGLPTALVEGTHVVGAPPMSRAQYADLYRNYRVLFPANAPFADRRDSIDMDKFWQVENPSVLNRCRRDLNRLAGTDTAGYAQLLYAQAILGVSLLSLDPVPRPPKPVPAGPAVMQIEEALDLIAAPNPDPALKPLISAAFNVTQKYLDRAVGLWQLLDAGDPLNTKSTAWAYLNLLRYHIANYHEPRSCASKFGGTPAHDCRDIDNLLAGLSSWPTIARLTGLCIDFDVDFSALQNALKILDPTLNGPFAVRVIVDPASIPAGYPQTMYEARCWTSFTWSPQAADQTFWPAPRPGRDEMIALTLDLPDKYQLRNIDVNADAHFATRQRQSLDHSESEGVAAKDLEVLQKGSVDCGLALVATKAADEAADSLGDESEQAASLGKKHGILLYADDLTVGYRIDIKSDLSADKWLSICDRALEYDFDLSIGSKDSQELKPLPIDEARAEGMVHKIARQTSGDKNENEITPNNILCQWRDHNIAVRDSIDPASGAPDNSAADQCKFPFQVRPSVTLHSQPRLRIDHDYFAGGRVVFANGSSLGRDAAREIYDGNATGIAATRLGDNGAAQDAFTMNRIEPIPPPQTHLAEPIDGSAFPGDEIDSIVVRTAADFPANDLSSRWIVAPRTSLENAEIEGALDEMRDLPDGALRDFRLDECGAVPSVRFLHPERCRGSGNSAPHCVDTLLERRGLGGGQQPQIPYYPHPAARSFVAALVDDPASAVAYQLGKILWYSAQRRWPDAPAIQLTVAKSNSAPVVIRSGSQVLSSSPDEAEHRLHLELPPGTVTYLQLWSSTSVKPAFQSLDVRKLKGLLKDPNLRDPRGRLKRTFLTTAAALIEDQAWPTINPRKTIRLVHAVQRPLRVPQFGRDFAVRRFLDSTSGSGPSAPPGPTSWNRAATRVGAHRNAALLEGTVEVDRKSTGRVDIRSERYDWTDDPAAKAGPCLVHIWDALPALELIDPTAQHDSVSLQINDAGAERNIWHEFKDSKHHHVGYHLTATSAFCSYFRHKADEADKFTLKSDEKNPEGRRVHVLSTQRPDVPVLDLILPAFEHEASFGSGWSRLRRRVGLKLWLNRPWFSSGNDEKLAIICGPGNLLPSRSMPDAEPAEPRSNRWTQDDLDASGPPETNLLPYISQIAMDPTAPYGELIETLPPGLFLDSRSADGRCRTDTNLILAESAAATEGPPITVSAAIYDVGAEDYDCDRMQYGVNVGIDMDALAWEPENLTFRPFIRLALARYQPFSVSGLELSRILVADLIQLQPNRTVQITYDPFRVDLFEVNVYEYGKSEWTMAGNIAAPDAANYSVRIELLRRKDAHARWVPVEDGSREVKIEKVGDGFLARARFPIESPRSASQYAIRVREAIYRRHGIPFRGSSDTFDGFDTRPQPVLFMIQPLVGDDVRESA